MRFPGAFQVRMVGDAFQGGSAGADCKHDLRWWVGARAALARLGAGGARRQ